MKKCLNQKNSDEMLFMVLRFLHNALVQATILMLIFAVAPISTSVDVEKLRTYAIALCTCTGATAVIWGCVSEVVNGNNRFSKKERMTKRVLIFLVSAPISCGIFYLGCVAATHLSGLDFSARAIRTTSLLYGTEMTAIGGVVWRCWPLNSKSIFVKAFHDMLQGYQHEYDSFDEDDDEPWDNE